MTLNMQMPFTRGRKAKPLPTVVSVRELSQDELMESFEIEQGVSATPLQRLSQRHKYLARLVAQGASNQECMARTGLSASRISILKSDPTFRDMVAFLTAEKDEVVVDFHSKMAETGIEALTLLQERLEDPIEASTITTKELLAITTITADRTGYGPKRVEEKNITLNIGDKLDEARKRARAALTQEVNEMIDITPETENA